MPTMDIPLDNSINIINGTICQSRICGHKVQGTDCGSDVSNWISLALGLPNLRLIKQSNNDNKEKGMLYITLLIKSKIKISSYKYIFFLQLTLNLNYHFLVKLNFY